MSDQTATLIEQVKDAAQQQIRLRIAGGNSKAFYGNNIEGELLSVASHEGIVQYDPSELVIRCRAGTRLQTLQETLAEHRQMLAFEPPAYSNKATIGGTLACGFSGPRRPYSGSARDFVLGMQLLNGQGEQLHLGGQVIKNVAGYDASRLMVGALGTLGVILEVSLKVQPMPEQEITLTKEMDFSVAVTQMHQEKFRSIPISAATYARGNAYLRLSDRAATLDAACKRLPDWTLVENGEHFWQLWNEQQIGFFNRSDKPLWRICVPSTTPPSPITDDCFLDWGGALRWIFTTMESEELHQLAAKQQGHAICVRKHGNTRTSFQPLSGALHRIHKNLKHAFDPHAILNVGKMYTDL